MRSVKRVLANYKISGIKITNNTTNKFVLNFSKCINLPVISIIKDNNINKDNLQNKMVIFHGF